MSDNYGFRVAATNLPDDGAPQTQSYVSPAYIPYAPSYQNYLVPAAPSVSPIVEVGSETPEPVEETKTFYQNMDEDVYEFGYADNNGERNEARDIYGVVTGSFNYVDDAGLAQTVRYKADKGGFQVLDTTVPVVAPISGPQPVQYTPEVLAAREAHLK